jgi:site-specific recombinase XerD
VYFFSGKNGREVRIEKALFKEERSTSSSHGGAGGLDWMRLSNAFTKCVLTSGLSDKLHFHSLRHTFATWLVQSGVGIYEVQKLMGHSSISVTQVYAHLAPSELHGAVNRISVGLN